MNILVTTSSFGIEIPKEFNIIHNPYKRKLTEDEVMDLIEQYQPVGMIAGVEPLTRKVMLRAKYLKVISRCGIGTDAVDMQAAKDLGIKVITTPEAPMVSVAELTLGLILSLSRRINTNDALIRAGKWKGPQGNLLSGKTVGIIGCGRIGTYVARLLKAFGCSVAGYDPYILSHSVCEMVSLDELLKTADIVTLHIPYSQVNHHLISAERIKLMKKSALIINAARGGLIDEEALYTALKKGELAGAAMDCFEKEPYSGSLASLENVVLTSHMGSSAVESRILMEKQALGNLINEFTKLGYL